MRKEGGFTLLELLIGLVVLGFILAGLNEGVRYGLRAADTQARLIGGRGDLDAVDRALRRLITQADPGAPQASDFRGAPNSVAFITTLPAAGADAVGRADVALRVDPNRRLMLRWAPHRYGVSFRAPKAPQDLEMLAGVERLELAYWSGGEWRRNWKEAALPSLVRFRLVFPPGDPRHWPDIVVEPMRRQPPE